MDVDGGGRRRKGAERRLRRHARKEAPGRDERMPRREVRVDARERTEPLRRAQFVLRPTRNVGRRVAELRRLFEEDAFLQDRPAGFKPRSEGADAFDVERLTAPAEAERRIEIVEARLPCLAGAACLNDDESGGESTVLVRR